MGCNNDSDVLGNCVLRKWQSAGGISGYYKHKCYEGVYTKKECMDKEVDDYTYHSYLEDQTCSEFCDANSPYGGCDEY